MTIEDIEIELEELDKEIKEAIYKTQLLKYKLVSLKRKIKIKFPPGPLQG